MTEDLRGALAHFYTLSIRIPQRKPGRYIDTKWETASERSSIYISLRQKTWGAGGQCLSFRKEAQDPLQSRSSWASSRVPD